MFAMSARQNFYLIFLALFIAQGVFSFYHPIWLWSFLGTLPFFMLGVYETLQKRHTILRIYPLVGRFRYWMEELRPKIYQYFVESDIDGTPIDRNTRSIIYQRSKKALSSKPFGTQQNLDTEGYEWVKHSLYPLDLDHFNLTDLRVVIGEHQCEKAYSSSLLNISAMSYGSLSHNAIKALSSGAKIGNFAHNTGEGGLSPYHIDGGGDLIWQIGTGYFGARTPDGQFDEKAFQEKACMEQVKMIELKLSQGAKPGHGGILPALKNTPEIAKIRGVEPYTDVLSPSGHKEFSDNSGLLKFVDKLRTLSGGKPVGIKLCVGHYHEFDLLVQTMVDEDRYPDYICVDGAEGGTGAAPLEFTNYMGAPLREGLIHVCNRLNDVDLKKKIKVIAAGRIFTSFDIVKVLALGADACYSARGMMLSLGCIQALVCNQNKCPTGIATQDPELSRGLVVSDKCQRVANFHHGTLEAVAEMMCAMGVSSLGDLKRHHIFRRVDYSSVKDYAELYPY